MKDAHVAIIGSGFGGLGAAIRLKGESIDDFVVLERAGDVGSTWRDNTYPGCACDIESHLYSFSFALEPCWSHRLARPPFAQLLIHPAADASPKYRSFSLFGEGFILARRDYEAFLRHYLNGVEADIHDPRLSPLCAGDLSCLPPALVAVAGFDILLDEGEAYARALADAGTAVRVLRFASLEHGFIHLTGICPAARQAMVTLAQEGRSLLDPAAPR